jgi:hypothetical protein
MVRFDLFNLPPLARVFAKARSRGLRYQFAFDHFVRIRTKICPVMKEAIDPPFGQAYISAILLMKGDNFPAVGKLLQIHRAIANHLSLERRKRD